MKTCSRLLLPLVAVMIVVAMTSCMQKMADQPRYEAYEASDFFEDGLASRPLPEGTVARGAFSEDEVLYSGKQNGQPATNFPFEITPQVMASGRERYEIYCTPCHDRIGTGQGMAVVRGFRRPPPSFHIERLRQEPPGHFVDVITNGFGAMSDYAAQLKPQDRWAIVAYIRALQLSQRAPLNMLSDNDRQQLIREAGQ